MLFALKAKLCALWADYMHSFSHLVNFDQEFYMLHEITLCNLPVNYFNTHANVIKCKCSDLFFMHDIRKLIAIS